MNELHKMQGGRDKEMANIRKLPMLLGVLIFVAAVALAGCGGGNSVNSSSINGNQGVSPNTANPSNGSESAAETAGPANEGTDKEPVTLKYTFWGSPQEKKALEEATKKFTEKYPWITVNAVHIPESDYDTKLTAMVAAGETPDAGYVHGELGEAWQKEGKFINFNEMFAKDTELKKRTSSTISGSTATIRITLGASARRAKRSRCFTIRTCSRRPAWKCLQPKRRTPGRGTSSWKPPSS